MRQFSLGALWLALGTGVYFVARPPGSVWFVPRSLNLYHWYSRIGPGELQKLAPLQGSFPTFAHTIAFSLMTNAVVSSGLGVAAVVCAGWTAIEIAFELMRLPGTTFDPNDIGAALAGGLVSFMTIVLLRRRKVFA